MRRPHEFVLLRAQPSRWQVTDVLAFAGLQAFALGANWDMELARLKDPGRGRTGGAARAGPRLSRRSPAERAGGDGRGTGHEPTGRGPGGLRLRRAVAGRVEQLGHRRRADRQRACRCWPTTRTSPPRLPAPWYLAHLRCPAWEVAGASFVGGPVVPDRAQRPCRLGHHGRHDGTRRTCSSKRSATTAQSVREGRRWCRAR